MIIDDIIQTDELHVQRPYGFFGITLPVSVRVPGTLAATAGNYTAPFFRAQRPYIVVAVWERHETSGTDGAAVTLMVKKVPSGTAPASGTDILTAGINLKGSPNIDQEGSITTTITSYGLDPGNSLALVTTGTLTSVAGVSVSITLQAA